MLSNVKSDIERADRVWYGSVFGSWCVLGAAMLALSFLEHGTFRFVLGLCYLAVFVFALNSFIIAIRKPRTKQWSSRIALMTLLAGVPWIVRLFLD